MAYNENPSYLTLGNEPNPTRSCFQAYCSGNISNVTGDGTVYGPIVFNTTTFDQNSNFNTSTGVFTAPVTGKYIFCGTLGMATFTAAWNQLILNLVTTSANYFLYECNPANVVDAETGYLFLPYSIIVNMSASDTASLSVKVNGSTKTLLIYGGVGACTFAGELLC